MDGFYVALGYRNSWLGSPSDVGEEKPWSPSAQDGPQLPLHPYTPLQTPPLRGGREERMKALLRTECPSTGPDSEGKPRHNAGFTGDNPRQFPLRPYSVLQFPLHPYKLGQVDVAAIVRF